MADMARPRDLLFEPVKLGRLKLRNRIVVSPMAVLSAQPNGRPSAQTAAVLAARAKGGVGLVIVGGTTSSQRGFDEKPFKELMRADVEAFVPDLARVADAVHEHGAAIVCEIMPGFGRMGVPGPDRPLIAASAKNVVIPAGAAMPFERVTPLPRAATVAEIQAYEQDTVDAALRLERAGWDGVELGAHMSYFFASFLTPRTNHRTDQYGGSLENRARILVNIVSAIRAAAGPDFVIGLRLSSAEYVEGGQDAHGYAAIAREVEAAGIDYVAPTPGCYESINETTEPKKLLIDSGDIAVFRAALSVPVLLMGIYNADEAAQAVKNGAGDLIMLGRPLLADPDFPNKVRDGREGAITQCDKDGYCVRRLMLGMPVRCKVNPTMGREQVIAEGAPLEDRSMRRFTEDAMLQLTATKPVVALAGALMASQNKRVKKEAERAQ